MDVVGRAAVAIEANTRGFRSQLDRDATRAARDVGRKSGRQLGAGIATGVRGASGLIKGAIVATAVVAVASGIKSVVSAAAEAESSTRLTEAAFKRLKVPAKAFQQAMADTSKEALKLGFDDEQATAALATMTRATGDLKGGTEAVNAVFDVARAKGIDLAAAQKLVVGAMAGQTRGLKQLGVNLRPVTTQTDKLKSRIAELRKEQKGASDDDKAALAATIERLKARAKDAKESDKQATAQKALREIQKALGDQAEEFAGTSSGALKRAGVAWENFKEDVGAALLPTVSVILEQFIPAVEAIGEAVGPALDTVRETLGEIVPQITGLLAGMFEGFDPAAFAASVVSAFGGITDAFAGGFGAGGGPDTSGFAAIGQQIRDSIVPQLATLGAEIGPAIGEALRAALPQIEAIAGDIGRQVAALVELISVVLDRAIAVWRRWGDEIKAVVSVAFRLAINQIRTALAIITGIIETVTAVLRGDWDAAWESLKGTVEAAVNGAVEAVRILGPAMLAALGAIVDQLGQSGGDLIDAISDGIKSGAKALPGVLAAAIAALPGIVSGFVGTMLAQGGNLATAIKDGMIAGLRALPGLLAGAVVTAVGALGGIVGSVFSIASSIGSAIIDGLVSGVTGAAGRLASAAVSAVTGALGAAKRAIGFGSPAKEFIPLGESMVDGMVKGIKAAGGRPIGVALTAAVKDGIRAAQRNLAGLTGDLGSIIDDLFAGQREQADKAFADQLAAAAAPVEAIRNRITSRDADRRIDELQRMITEQRNASGEFIASADLAGLQEDLALAIAEREQRLVQQTVDQQQAGLEATLDATSKGLQDAITLALDKLQRGGSPAEFRKAIDGALEAAGIDADAIGSVLGEVVGREFGDILAALRAQVGNLGPLLPGVEGRTPPDTTGVVNVAAVRNAQAVLTAAQQQLRRINQTVRQEEADAARAAREARAKGSAGGTEVTKGEQQMINLAERDAREAAAAARAQETQVSKLEAILQALINPAPFSLTYTLSR